MLRCQRRRFYANDHDVSIGRFRIFIVRLALESLITQTLEAKFDARLFVTNGDTLF